MINSISQGALIDTIKHYMQQLQNIYPQEHTGNSLRLTTCWAIKQDAIYLQGLKLWKVFFLTTKELKTNINIYF